MYSPFTRCFVKFVCVTCATFVCSFSSESKVLRPCERSEVCIIWLRVQEMEQFEGHKMFTLTVIESCLVVCLVPETVFTVLKAIPE